MENEGRLETSKVRTEEYRCTWVSTVGLGVERDLGVPTLSSRLSTVSRLVQETLDQEPRSKFRVENGEVIKFRVESGEVIKRLRSF